MDIVRIGKGFLRDLPGCSQSLVVSNQVSGPFQHNCPAAGAAPVVDAHFVADNVPAGLLAVFVANPLGVVVAVRAGRFSGGGGAKIPSAMTAKTPTPMKDTDAIRLSIMLPL